MKLSEIYSRDIEAKLNAVVSTGDLDTQTVKTEIDEYVFTVDIVNGLYKTLSAMKNGSVNHNGVWVQPLELDEPVDVLAQEPPGFGHSLCPALGVQEHGHVPQVPGVAWGWEEVGVTVFRPGGALP